MANLPRTVHLVAQAPELDAKRLPRAVFDAQVAIIAAARMIGVFHDVSRRVRAARAQIDGVHHLGIGLFAPVRELMQAHLVGLGGKPGKIQPVGTLRARAHAVLPVKAADEIATRIAHHRHVQLANEVDRPGESRFHPRWDDPARRCRRKPHAPDVR